MTRIRLSTNRDTLISSRIRSRFVSWAVFLLTVLVPVLTGRLLSLWEEAKDPLGILLGATLGFALYYLTVALVFQRFRQLSSYLQEVKRALVDDHSPFHRMVISGVRVISEEVFWRGTMQYLLGNGALALICTAVLFTLWHIYMQRESKRLTYRVVLEFFLFSLVLGFVYAISGRILLVIGIHYVRNLLISAECAFDERTPALCSMPASQAEGR